MAYDIPGVTKQRNKSRREYLDGKKLFEVYWVEMGAARSTSRLVKWCLSNKMISPTTGKTDRMAVWKAMYRYAVTNIDEAYVIAQKGVSQHGDFITPEEWKQNMASKQFTAFQSKAFTDKYAREWSADFKKFMEEKEHAS